MKRNNLFQTTLRSSFSLTGLGAFTGKKVTINCRRAKEDSGIVFVTKKGRIKADWRNIRLSKRLFHTTELAKGEASITTTEHILSAFYGMGADNVIIELDSGSSVPVFDVSARFFAQGISKVGLRNLSARRRFFKVSKPLFFKQKDSFIIFVPSNEFRVHAIIDFPNVIGMQRFSVNLENGEKYLKEISFARSFFSKPIEKAKWEKYKKELKILSDKYEDSNIIVFDNEKFISKLRCKNEPVRHKILDFLGDFALSGKRIKGEAILYKPSHALSREVAEKIARAEGE